MGISQLTIVNASQGHIHEYENTKRKLYSCNSSINFNRQCLHKKLVPTYVKLKFPNNSPTAKFTQRIAHHLRIKDKLKYLYMKKQQLNLRLYRLHLLLANIWGNTGKYEGRSESKERFAIQRYLLTIGKKQNMQVLSHTFTYFST